MDKPKLLRLDNLLKVGESEYQKDTIIYQAGNRKDSMIILVCWINFYNIQNLLSSTLTAKSMTDDYQ